LMMVAVNVCEMVSGSFIVILNSSVACELI
jgi:hypothetical protein